MIDNIFDSIDDALKKFEYFDDNPIGFYICKNFWCKASYEKRLNDNITMCPKCVQQEDVVTDNGYKTYKADKVKSNETFQFNVSNLSDKYFKR